MSSSQVDLLVDWCSYEAAKFAVERWHYSKTMPSSYTRLVKCGIWEDGSFVGAIIFSHGSNRNIGSPYNLTIYEASELVRVAMTLHQTPTSQSIAKAMRLVKGQSPGLRLFISYADPAHGHLGTVYQALNWIYVGQSSSSNQYLINGKVWHKKAAWASFGTNKADALGAKIISVNGKHKYLYPLDRAMRRQIEPLAQPYPKRAGEVHDGA